MAQGWFRPDSRMVLDLGDVRDLAEVLVNGQAVGVAWAAPFQVDVTAALKPGANRLEVKVTNQWTNRIAGDQIAPAAKKVLTVSPGPARGGLGRGGGAPLPESGLLGPVKIVNRTMTK